MTSEFEGPVLDLSMLLLWVSSGLFVVLVGEAILHMIVDPVHRDTHAKHSDANETGENGE